MKFVNLVAIKVFISLMCIVFSIYLQNVFLFAFGLGFYAPTIILYVVYKREKEKLLNE